MGLFCFLSVNTISAAQEQQGMVLDLLGTQHGFVSTDNGIKGEEVIRESFEFVPRGWNCDAQGCEIHREEAGTGGCHLL